jgi:hypothetical protein
MKRRFSLPTWSQFSRNAYHRRRRREEREVARRAHQSVLAEARRSRAARIHSAPEQILRAPSHFCLVDNTEAVIDYFEQVSVSTDRGHNVLLDFREVETLAPDAVVLLISQIRDRRLTHAMRVRVAKPAQPEAKRLWNDSGIREHVRLAEADDEEWPEPRGRIITKRRFRAEPEDAAFLKDFAEQRLAPSFDVWPGVQTILLECMTNTFNHAEGARREQRNVTHEPWWAGVYCDKAHQVAKFTFLDNGIGILESIKLKRMQEVFRWAGFIDNAEALKQVFSGQVPSTTGLHYRGEGLPTIREVLITDGEVDRVVVVANDVRVDLGADTYQVLQMPFRGTMVYWEKKGTWQPGF